MKTVKINGSHTTPLIKIRAGDTPAAVVPPAEPEQPKARIYVVDDHVLIRHGLINVISTEPDMEVCGQAEDAIHGLEEIVRLKPDVVIVDIALKGLSGLELLKKIRALSPHILTLVVSIHPDSVFGIRALGAGARGYVMKHEATSRIVTAIRRLRAGSICISSELAEQLLHRSASHRTDRQTSFAPVLSERETEVVTLIGNGFTTREIAVKLNLSLKTVETHRGHIKEKLNSRNGTQLVQSCVRWVEEHVTRRAVPSAVGAA
jgi:DNA-binding NarL/FixJ family response regulator